MVDWVDASIKKKKNHVSQHLDIKWYTKKVKMSTGSIAMHRVIDARLLQIHLTSECKSIDFPSYLSLRALFLANI